MYNYSDIIGNENIIQSLKNAVRNNHSSHAYIISGPEGSGKGLIAMAFAKTLLCADKSKDGACNNCVSCHTFDTLNNPDLIILNPTKEKSISVRDIREQITVDINIKPYSNAKKVYIIPRADTLTAEAQNALLKTLEEPPEYAVVILVAENSELFLPTILSRCISYEVKPLPYEAIQQYLIDKGIAGKDNAGICAEYSMGYIGQAIKIAVSEEFSAHRDNVLDIVNNIPKSPYHYILSSAKELESYKISEVLDIIYLWYRDVIIYKATNDTNRIIEKDRAKSIQKFANQTEYDKLLLIPTKILEAKKQIKSNAKGELVLMVLFMNIKGDSK